MMEELGIDAKFIWGIAVVFVLFVSNFAGLRMSIRKDLHSHSKRIKENEDDIKERKTIPDCREDRGDFKENISEIKKSFDKMDEKLDHYIFRNGLKGK